MRYRLRDSRGECLGIRGQNGGEDSNVLVLRDRNADRKRRRDCLCHRDGLWASSALEASRVSRSDVLTQERPQGL